MRLSYVSARCASNESLCKNQLKAVEKLGKLRDKCLPAKHAGMIGPGHVFRTRSRAGVRAVVHVPGPCGCGIELGCSG